MSFLIAAASILAAWGLHRALEETRFVLPWWIDLPSVMGFYGLFHEIFDRRLWRTGLVRFIRLVAVPVANGRWTGYLISSFDPEGGKKPVTLNVVQTWRRIRIVLETESSESRSLSASMVADDPRITTISYEYLNEPKAHARATMHAHRGTARLAFRSTEDAEVLDGEYYTGRDRQNLGILHFERPSRKGTRKPRVS